MNSIDLRKKYGIHSFGFIYSNRSGYRPKQENPLKLSVLLKTNTGFLFGPAFAKYEVEKSTTTQRSNGPMRSLTYKNLIWKTTWYKKNGAAVKTEVPMSATPAGAKASPRRLERLQSAHWSRAVKHGWSKV